MNKHKIDHSRPNHERHAMGHRYVIYDDTGEIRDLDTGRLVKKINPACKICKKKATKDGHDPCIAGLPGVKFACCGHGGDGGYIMFENGKAIYGDFVAVVEFGPEGELSEMKFPRWYGDRSNGIK